MSTHLKEVATTLVATKPRKHAKDTKIVIMVKLSPELASVTGVDRCERTKVSRYLWNYIKEKKLQDPSDGRRILCDEKLKLVMGNSSISMFEMAVRVIEISDT